MPPRWRAAMAVAAIILPELSESLSAQYSYECAPVTSGCGGAVGPESGHTGPCRDKETSPA